MITPTGRGNGNYPLKPSFTEEEPLVLSVVAGDIYVPSKVISQKKKPKQTKSAVRIVHFVQ